MTVRIPILAAALLLAGGAFAEEPKPPGMDHEHMDHAGHRPVPTDSPATAAFKQVDATMHRDMAITYRNDVDLDFVHGMIPHHQGAVGMAKVVLEHSKDPDLRALAERIVKDQEAEIAEMQAWLAKRDGK